MSINLYSCSQADLESLNKVGPDTAAKIISLRQQVIAGMKEPLQVEDLAKIRLSVEDWQGFIDEGLLTINLPPEVDPDYKMTGSFDEHEPDPKEENEETVSFEAKVSNSITLLAQSLGTLDKTISSLDKKLTDKLDEVTESVTTLQKQNSGFKSDLDSLKSHGVDMEASLEVHGAFLSDVKNFLFTPASVSTSLQTLWGSGVPTPSHLQPPSSVPSTLGKLWGFGMPTPSQPAHVAPLTTITTQPDVKPKITQPDVKSKIQQAEIEAIKNVIPPTGIYNGKAGVVKTGGIATTTMTSPLAPPMSTIAPGTLTMPPATAMSTSAPSAMAIPPAAAMLTTLTPSLPATPISTTVATKTAGTPDDTETDKRGRSRNRRRRGRQSTADSDSSLSLSPAPPKMDRFSGDPAKLSWSGFIAKFTRTSERRCWSERKKMDRLFDCLTDKALEYANRSQAETYEALKRELSLRFDLKDAPVACRSKLHVIRQDDEESLEDFLQRVLTVTMDGFDKAEITTLQQLATESFLRGCKHKEAAMTVMNEGVGTIHDACRRVKTIIANKRAIGGGKVTFQEKVFTVDEETRVTNIEKKLNEIAQTLQQTSSNSKSPPPPLSRYEQGGQSQNWQRQRSPSYYRDSSPRGSFGTGSQPRAQSPIRGTNQNAPRYRDPSPVRQGYGNYPYRGDTQQRSPGTDMPYRAPDRYGYPVPTPGYPYYPQPPPSYPPEGYYTTPPWYYRDREGFQRSGQSPQRTNGPPMAYNTGQRPPYPQTNRSRSPDPKVRSTGFDESVPDLNGSGLSMPATNA